MADLAQGIKESVMDVQVNKFIRDCYSQEGNKYVSSEELYSVYKQWAMRNGFDVLSHNHFGRVLSYLGFKKRKGTQGQRQWKITFDVIDYRSKCSTMHPISKEMGFVEIINKMSKTIEKLLMELEQAKEELNDYKEENRQLRALKQNDIRLNKVVQAAMIKYGD